MVRPDAVELAIIDNPYSSQKDAILRALGMEHRGLKVEEVQYCKGVSARVYERSASICQNLPVVSSAKAVACPDTALLKLPNSSSSSSAPALLTLLLQGPPPLQVVLFLAQTKSLRWRV